MLAGVSVDFVCEGQCVYGVQEVLSSGVFLNCW